MPFPASGAAIDPSVPISAIEEELRRLGLNMSQGVPSVLPPPEFEGGRPQPESAVAAIMAMRDKQRAAMAQQAAPPPAPVAEPLPELPPEEPKLAPKKPDGGDGISPWWMLPLAAAALLGRKGLARKGKGAKSVDSAAGEIKEPGKGVQRPPQGSGLKHPGMQKKATSKSLPAPTEQKLLTYQPQAVNVNTPDAAVALPPPSLTQIDAPPAISQALVERARGNIRGPVSDRMPPEPTPRPVLPTYTAPLETVDDFSGSEIAKALRVSGQIARTRAKSAAKTERLNKKRPQGRPSLTPDRRVPQEEGERKSFNEVVKAIRDAKTPLKEAVKDLKPWLKEPKKDIGQPVLPRKKPGPNPKPKYKPVPETAKALAKRKVDTALKSKRKPRSKKDK